MILIVVYLFVCLFVDLQWIVLYWSGKSIINNNKYIEYNYNPAAIKRQCIFASLQKNFLEKKRKVFEYHNQILSIDSFSFKESSLILNLIIFIYTHIAYSFCSQKTMKVQPVTFNSTIKKSLKCNVIEIILSMQIKWNLLTAYNDVAKFLKMFAKKMILI